MLPAAERDRLVLDNRPWAYHQARFWRNRSRLVARLDQDDADSAALLGLVVAARHYDPARGTRFTTYATHWIRACLQREARRQGGAVSLPATTARSRGLLDATREALRHAEAAPLRVSRGGRGEDGWAGGSRPAGGSLEPSCDGTAAEDASRREAGERVARLLEPLPARLRLAVELVCLQGMTLSQAGRVLGVVKERVRQMKSRGIELMREACHE